jgi:hypothetical protein
MDFTTKVPDPDSDSESVQTFLSTTEGAFQAHPLFANATDEELESAGEVLPFSAPIRFVLSFACAVIIQ